jgi:hypothetical protein
MTAVGHIIDPLHVQVDDRALENIHAVGGWCTVIDQTGAEHAGVLIHDGTTFVIAVQAKLDDWAGGHVLVSYARERRL